jgi:hypothetical protein
LISNLRARSRASISRRSISFFLYSSRAWSLSGSAFDELMMTVEVGRVMDGLEVVEAKSRERVAKSLG